MRILLISLLFLNILFSKEFVIDQKKYNDITISTKFFKKHSNLSQVYIDKSIYYIKMYENLIGEFPYKNFTIIESKEQVGYSMPTYTVIGDRLLDKPFLIERSLGHEIVHQYFGDSVFNDFEKGNWVEGISTYLADEYYEELKQKGYLYRKNILRDYQLFVDKSAPLLKDFQKRVDRASMLVGYNRGANVFHTIKQELGSKKFYKLLKEFYQKYKFKYATFDDIKNHFGVNIDFLLNKRELIDLNITNMNTFYDKGSYHVEFNINANTNTLLPIWINDSEKFSIRVDQNISKITLSLKQKPKKIVFDKNYDLFRKLTKKEIPITLSSFFAKEPVIIVGKEAKKYQKLFKNAKAILDQNLTFDQSKNAHIIFLKDSIKLANKFIPNLEFQKDGFYIQSAKNPWNESKIVSFVYSKDDNEFNKIKRKLKRYLKYSTLYFKDGKVIKQEILKSQRGIVFLFQDQAIIKVPNSLKFDNLIENIKDKRVIYVGEAHTNFAHHLNQLNIIKALHDKGKKIAIGMEMFQKPYQFALDKYIDGNLSQREFLQKSEYFKRWGFDYNLYKPILDFAKENKIPVIALNIQKEIIKKITKGGFLSLEQNESKFLPKKLDFSNKEYKDYLQNFFNSPIHKEKTKNSNIEFVYQSQIVWDESMAEGIKSFLNKNKEYSIVALTGNGHLKKRFGIPYRVYRDTNLSYSVILQDVNIESQMADFVLFPPKMDYKKAIKLGVYLDTSKGLKITKVIKNSIADKLGLMSGDEILSIDHVDVKKLYQLKQELFFKTKDSNISIKIKRKDKILTLNRI